MALNFLQRLSGVATLTARFVEAVQGTGAQILDTRKTTPGWRRLEKYAVTCGGGRNHRFGLFDMVLIKDNHLAALRGEQPNAIAAAVRARPGRLSAAQSGGRGRHPRTGRTRRWRPAPTSSCSITWTSSSCGWPSGNAPAACPTEASGGVTLDTVRAIAETGVDFISVGALTHSARAVDIGLDFERTLTP